MLDDLSQRVLVIPVSAVLRRKMVKGDFWETAVWSLETVLVGASIVNQDADGLLLPATTEDAGYSRYLWSGFNVTLYRDACERYWHALIGDEPKVYVVMDEDETSGEVEPALVTIDYDEATAHSEIDADVLGATIPSELYHLMEQYVMTHYKPVEFKKRKRKNWSGENRVAAVDGDEPVDPWDERRRFHRPGYHG